MFITFEGADGCGKSTQSRRLAERLRAQGFDVVSTREPGGSIGAEQIRALILSGDADRWSAETELLLFNAARRDHLEKTVWPALAAGKIVICDRFVDSTRAYQGVARSDMMARVDDLHRLMIGCEADLTLILDIDAKTSWLRGTARLAATQGPDEARFERMGVDFQERLLQAFGAIAARFAQRCRLIDANGSVDAISARIDQCVELEMQRRGIRAPDHSFAPD